MHATTPVVAKGAQRFLYVANPGESDDSSSDDEMKARAAESSSYVYQPPPLPNPTPRSPRAVKPLLPQYAPAKLTTNLPPDHGHHYTSSFSNPALSSPSTTSSPAVESSPPPSTPGVNVYTSDLPGEPLVRQEPAIGQSFSDKGDGPQIASRATHMFEKLLNKAHIPHRSSHQQRSSGGYLNPSPTSSIADSYASPTNLQTSRTTPTEKLLIMLTTNADNYTSLEISGARDAAVIRERIFGKLQIADEDQIHYSIYRTSPGKFAIGDALNDEQLGTLCREKGDDQGSLWFFVSHSSAPVHELPHGPVSPTTVSTIPPPVLPYNGNAYTGPLRTRLGRPRSHSRHGGSASSASERLPQEVGPGYEAGYEASASDDVDHAEREASSRSAMRPPHSKSMASALKNYPLSPERSRRPNGPMHRPMSPLYSLRPASPSTSVSEHNLEPPSSRIDQYNNLTPTPPSAAPPASMSPRRGSLDEHTLTPPALNRHGRSGSDAALEREHALQAGETQQEQADRQWQQYYEREGKKLERDRNRGPYKKERTQRDYQSQQSPEDEDGFDKPNSADSWVVVPNDASRTGVSSKPSASQDSARISPTIGRERRNHLNSPYKPTSPYSGGRPPIPNVPRNPPPLPTTGDSRSSSSRITGQAVPPKWAVSWKGPDRNPDKNEQRPVPPPVSTPQWNRLAAKSMSDLRNAQYNVPPSLRSGRGGNNPLPVNGPPDRGVSIPSPNYGENSPIGRENQGSNIPGAPKSYDPHRTQARPLPRHGSSNQSPLNFSQSPPNTFGSRMPLNSPPASGYSTMVSPSIDPYPRPLSALGSATSPSGPQDYANRFYRNEVDDGDTLPSPHPMSPHRQASINGRLGYRDDGLALSHSTSRQVLRLNPNALGLGTYVSHSSEPYGASDTTRTPPRSPASPLSPRNSWRPSTAESVPTGLYGASSGNSSSTKVEEGVNSNGTLRQEDHGWIGRLLDGGLNESSTLVPKSSATLVPLPRTSLYNTNPPANETPPPLHPLPPLPPHPPPVIPAKLQTEFLPSTAYNNSSSTLVIEDDSDTDDDDDDGGGTLWQTRPTPKSPKTKSINRGHPALTLQTDKISNAPSAFRAIPKDSDSSSSKKPSPPESHLRKPITPNSAKNRQRGSTFTDNEYTWAPRPAPEEVYDRLEEFFPEHDLDKPVIEANSGAGSPTATEYPPVPPVPDREKPDRSSIKAKKSIRIVAEEHKKRIDRTSRAENFANVFRKRSTKLWGSRLEEVTTEQPRTEVSKPQYNKPPPPPPLSETLESPSGGPRPIFKWVRGELIGKGTYGRVYLALNATTGEMIAVKQVEIPQTASDKNDTRQAVFVKALKLESETLKDLDHPNVVQYLGFEETPSFLSIFLEYVPGGSIGSCLQKHGKFDEEVTKSFTEQILTGLEYLHSKGILHRDMKADNILVETTGVCKISDFGIAKKTDDINGIGASTAMQGTVFWMAPEVIDTPKTGYDKKIDIWSVGCVVLEMWAGKRPWSGDEAIQVILKLHKSKLPPPIPDDVILSPLGHDFRNKCFAINPEDRPTAAVLRTHPYLTLPPDWVFNGFKSEHI